MGTKTIGIREETYERLKARKWEGESYSDVINRLLDETTVDWREGFGTLDTEDAEQLERVIKTSRTQTSEGLETRQQEVLDDLSETEDH